MDEITHIVIKTENKDLEDLFKRKYFKIKLEILRRAHVLTDYEPYQLLDIAAREIVFKEAKKEGLDSKDMSFGFSHDLVEEIKMYRGVK